MIISQLSVFLENKPGRLAYVTNVLAKNKIDISALSMADTEKYGILRIIVNDVDFAKKVLTDEGIIVKVNHVIAIGINDVPGGALKAINIISSTGSNIEYMYACIGLVTGKALMIIRTDDCMSSEQALVEQGFESINPSDIYRF